MHVIEVKQRMGEDDIAAIARLARAAEKFDGHPPLGEHKWLDLVQGGRSGFAGFVAREQAHARVVGYAQLSRGHDSWAVEVVVHPSWRDPDAGVAEQLLGHALSEVAGQGGGHLHFWVPKPSPADDDVANKLGLRRGRELFQMRRKLPLEDDLKMIEPLATRAFRPGVDDLEWLELNNRAFADHPEQGSWDEATLSERLGQPWFDPESFLLYEEAGRIAAFCWIKVHDDDPPLGEIYVIGVDPDLQAKGLGRRLLRTGLAHLEATGPATAMLYVDADNGAAVALYDSFGFSIDHLDRAYVVDVAASK